MDRRAADRVLEWALPRLGLRWQGFRRVRGQVEKRLLRRCAELGLPDLAAYRSYLEATPGEWAALDALARVTISRFARDREVWTALVEEHLRQLVRERPALRAWSAGCGAGEEPYTLAIAWRLAVAPAGASLDLLASDAHEGQLARAALATYPAGTLRELPEAWRRAAFDPVGEQVRLREPFRSDVRFVRHDLRDPPPEGDFDLILCRNAAFTYFAEPLQARTAAALRGVLRPGGLLVLGLHEAPPAGFTRVGRSVYQAALSRPSRTC